MYSIRIQYMGEAKEPIKDRAFGIGGVGQGGGLSPAKPDF